MIEKMPNIYKFSKEAMNFTNAYAEYGHTQPSFQTLFESEWIYKLKDAGYYTIGINYNAYLSSLQGYDQGFDFWHDFISREGEKSFIDDCAELHQILYERLQNGVSEPFFIWLHYMDCHTPYYPLKWTPEMLMADVGSPLMKINKKTIKRIKNQYNYATQYLDTNLGKLFEFLKKKGYYDDSMIIISADHGEEFYEYGKFGHDAERDNEVVRHIPMIIKGFQSGYDNSPLLFQDISKFILNEISNVYIYE